MAKTRQQKEAAVGEYVTKLQKAKGLVFANFAGLKVKDIEALRKLCRQEKLDYVVTKKTLMDLAFKQAKLTNVTTENLDQGLASIFAYHDEVAPARVIANFAKEHAALKAVGGMLDSAFIDSAKVMELSRLPSKQELLAKLLGSMKAPTSGLVNVMAGVMRNFVGVLSAIKDTK